MLSRMKEPACEQRAPAVRHGHILRLQPSDHQAAQFITPEKPGDPTVISVDVSGSMGCLHPIIKDAVQRVLEACALLEIPPGSVRFVFWSSRLNGEVTNSGSAENDLGVLAAIRFDGGTDYNRGIEPFSADTVNLFISDGQHTASYGDAWKEKALGPMNIRTVFIGRGLPEGECGANLRLISPTTRLIEHVPSYGPTTPELRAMRDQCAKELANLIMATMTHAMPAGPSVQVATRSGLQLVRLARAADDSLVGVMPLGTANLVAPDKETTLPIEPGPISFETAMAAPTEELAQLATELLRAVEYGATDLQKELAVKMEGMVTKIMDMLKTHDKKHPDIEAYRALLDQVKRVSRSGDTGATETLSFCEGLVARSVGFLVGHKRDLKAAAKIEKLKLDRNQLEKMTAAAALIGKMVAGPNGTAIIMHSPMEIGKFAAGLQNPQAFRLPPSTKVSMIASDGRTVKEIAQTQPDQSLLVPDVPDGQQLTPDQIKTVVAALFALNIDPNASMLLCLVSIAGQLAEDGHNDAAQIFLGWFKQAIPHIWKDPQQMVAIVTAASDPHAFLLLRKDAQIAKPASPRDLHLLARMLMEYLDAQGIEYPPIPADALAMTKLVLRLIREKKQDPNLRLVIEQAVRAVTGWTFNADNNFQPVPSACDFGAAAAELHPLLDQKMTGASPTLAGGVVDVVAALNPNELLDMADEAFVLAALWDLTGPMPKTLTGVVKPGPAQLAEQQRLCVEAFTAEWRAAIKQGNLPDFKKYLATCYDGLQPELLCPGNGAHEEMAKILLTGSPGCSYTPANLGEERLNQVATFLLDAIRGNSATIQRLAAGKHPLSLIPRPLLKTLHKEHLITVGEFHEACPPDAGPVPGSSRFQRIVREKVKEIAPEKSDSAIVILTKPANPGTPAEVQRDLNLGKAGLLPGQCVMATRNFLHPSCVAYILQQRPDNKRLQVTRIVLADGTTVDALNKKGRTTRAEYKTTNISWKGHDAFAHLQAATAAAPGAAGAAGAGMSAAASEIHGLAVDIEALRKDYANSV